MCVEGEREGERHVLIETDLQKVLTMLQYSDLHIVENGLLQRGFIAIAHSHLEITFTAINFAGGSFGLRGTRCFTSGGKGFGNVVCCSY